VVIARVPRRPALLFYALTLAFLWQPLTQRVVHAPMDVIGFVPPWTSTAPPTLTRETASNYELQDVPMQMLPWAHQVRSAWRSGTIPLWNDLAGCGYPLLGNAQSAALSPLRILALPLPLAYAMSAEAAMKILIALTFTFLYCRRRYDVLPSLAGAVAFGFGTFLIVWLHFPHSTVAAFLPAVLYQIDLLAEKPTRGRFAFAALLGPLILFGGHPETTAHIVFFAALYAIWIVITERPKRFVPTLIAACVVATLLSLPMLVPVGEGITQSARHLDLEARPNEGIPFSDFPSLALLANPHLYGKLPGPEWGTAAAAESICGFAGLLGLGAWLALLLRRDWRSREMFFVVASALLFLLLDDFSIFGDALQGLMPLVSHSRLRLPFLLMTALMTAAALNDKAARLPAIGFAVAIIAFLFIRLPWPDDAARRAALLAMIPSFLTLALFALKQRALVIAALFAELWFAAHHWNPVRPVEELYPRTPLIDALLRQDRDGWRTLGIGGMLFPNTNAMFGIEDVRPHDPMANGRLIALLQRETRGFDTKQYYAKWVDTETPLIDYVGARWIVSEQPLPYRLVYEGEDGRLYENTKAKPRFFSSQALVTIRDRETIEVHAPAQALIETNIAWWKDWRVTHGGKRIETKLIRGAFLGFTVPPGKATVKVEYVPVTFYASAAVALLTALALLLWSRAAKPPLS
ncbi:MAG TPA: YfhO family protein, partial [Thermoanaerobaculia bacterium]